VSVTSSAKASPATKTSSHLPSQVQPARSPSAGSSASFVSAKQDSTLSFLVKKVANGQEGKGYVTSLRRRGWLILEFELS
jgi:hypothetical protein